MAQDEVPAQGATEAQGSLQVYGVSRTQGGERGAGESFRTDLEDEAVRGIEPIMAGVNAKDRDVVDVDDSTNILAFSALTENGRAIRRQEMQKLLLGYRDNMRVEVGTGVAVTAKTVADLRALTAWPDGLALNIHVDLDPRFSVVRVQRAASVVQAS